MKDKPIGLWGIFCISSGAMISSGLFVLPAVVYGLAGPGIIIAYGAAGLLMIPSLLSKIELATAMPRAGGTYFFIDRSLGRLFGNFAGLANWLSISLKGAFALIGIGAFVQLIVPDITLWEIKLMALGFMIFFTLVSLFSTKGAGRIQIILVVLLLGIIVFFIVFGLTHTDPSHFTPFLPRGARSLLPVTGMVFISYGGLTKVASLAGEVDSPGQNLPKGMFLSFIVVNILYLLSIFVTIGLLSPDEIVSTLTPISTAARVAGGQSAMILLSVAAILAFATTANASILSASRVPLAMAQDNILPGFIAKGVSKRGVPVIAVVITSLFMTLVIVLLDIESLVKTASTMMLILFSLVNLSVIIMRQSRLISYQPVYRAPFYPFLQIFGILTSLILIFEMGEFPLILSLIFFATTSSLYLFLHRKDSISDSALFRIVERSVANEVAGLHLRDELTEIIRERDHVTDDHFDSLVRRAVVLDMKESVAKDILFKKIATALALRSEIPVEKIQQNLEQREAESTTALSSFIAVPHLILEDENADFDLVIIRCREGVCFSDDHPEVKAIFSLAGSKKERNLHLKALMAIARIVQQPRFQKQWVNAYDEEELRTLVLIADRPRNA